MSSVANALAIKPIARQAQLLDVSRSSVYAREKVYMWGASHLMAMRMYEYKIHVKVTYAEAQWLDIDMATIRDIGLAPWLLNLFIDPKEQYPVGHRMNAWLASMAAELKAHAATFKKYPPKDIGLGQ